MKPKKIEPILFSVLTFILIVSLLNFKWINLFVYLDFIGLIGIWVYGYFKRNYYKKDGFDKSEFVERLFVSVLILGLIFNVTEIDFSSSIIALGLIILFFYFIIKGIRKLINKNFFIGLELIIVSFILLGYFLRLRHFLGGSPINIVFVTLLSMLYLTMSLNFIVEFARQKKYIIGIVGMCFYLSSIFYINAILFDTFFWPGSMILFLVAIISSLTVFAVYIFQTNQQNEKIRALYKRLVILISLSTFFAVANPKQFIRLDFGNRPHMIDSWYDCSFNNEIDEFTKTKSCEEFYLLMEIQRTGNYPEGVATDKDLELLKQWYLEAKTE